MAGRKIPMTPWEIGDIAACSVVTLWVAPGISLRYRCIETGCGAGQPRSLFAPAADRPEQEACNVVVVRLFERPDLSVLYFMSLSVTLTIWR